MDEKQIKDERINVRVTPDVKATIALAASLTKTTVTNFIVDNAYEAAQEVVMSHRDYELPADKWQQFLDAIDRPAQNIPALEKLAKKQTVFDKQREAQRQSQKAEPPQKAESQTQEIDWSQVLAVTQEIDWSQVLAETQEIDWSQVFAQTQEIDWSQMFAKTAVLDETTYRYYGAMKANLSDFSATVTLPAVPGLTQTHTGAGTSASGEQPPSAENSYAAPRNVIDMAAFVRDKAVAEA